MAQIQIRSAADGTDRLFPWAGSSSATVRRLETAFRDALTAPRRLSDRAAELSRSGKFTEAGAAAEGRAFAKSELLPGVARGTLALQQARRQVKDSWAKLKPTAPDKTDVVAFFKRESIRDELRSLTQEQRNNYLTRYELHPEIALAALESIDLPWTAPEARFISEQCRRTLTRKLVAAQNQEAVAELDEIEKAIEFAAPVIEKARGELQSNLAMNDNEFQQAILAVKATPIWLRKMGGEIRVITPGGTARLATAEEIADGVYFDGIEAYQAAIGAAA